LSRYFGDFFTPHHQKATGVNPWMNEKNIPKGNAQKPRLLSCGAGFTEASCLREHTAAEPQ